MMRLIFLAQLVVSSSLRITDLDKKAWQEQEHEITQDDIRAYVEGHRRAFPESDPLRKEKSSLMQKDSSTHKTVASKHKKLKALKKAALKKTSDKKKTHQKKQRVTGASLMRRAEKQRTLMNKVEDFKVHVDFLTALKKEMNRAALEKKTERVKKMSMLQVDTRRLPPADRKALGLMSEAEEKVHNEELRKYEEERLAATPQFKETLKLIEQGPHYLRRIVSIEDMSYLAEKFGGPALKDALHATSMLQVSKQMPHHLKAQWGPSRHH